MRIIPVIDIKKGKAVRAYKGERDKYKEICEVQDLVEKYCENKFNLIYVADLDAIMFDSKRNFDLIKDIAINNPVNLMVDFGIRNIEEYNAIKEKLREGLTEDNVKNISIIIGTETWKSGKFPDDAIISIDAVDGKILGENFDDVVGFLKNNANPFIAIDLKHIGTSNPNVELCARIFELIKRKFIYGGGVTSNNIAELEQYCSGVIIGTEIYERLNLI